MKHDVQTRNAVRREIDEELSFLNERPSLRSNIMLKIKGEKAMKKKLSAILLFAFVIAMLSVAALALSLSRQYFEDAARLQFSSGYYDDWTWAEKRAMVDILQKNGLITKEQASSMTNEAAVDAYMIERYGVNGRSDTIGLWAILEKELGPISTWSLEQKAWYTDMQIEIGLLTRYNDDSICALPEKDDTQPDEAVAIAKKAIIEAYGITEDTLGQLQLDLSFETHASDWERSLLHYSVIFWKDGAVCYSCYITRDGRVMDSSMGEAFLSPSEEAQAKIQFANENDLEAIKLFQQYAQEHIEGDDNFVFWPLEDKKAVTDLLRPVILDNMAANPDYADHTRIFWATHTYGLPDENAISQENAIALAKAQLVSTFGLSEKAVSLFDRIGLFYETTDPKRPLWKITFKIGAFRDEAQALGIKLSNNYRIVLDAYTGDVLETYLVTGYSNTPERAAMEN